MDDDFLADQMDQSDAEYDQAIAKRNLNKLRIVHENAGYKAGLEESTEKHLQRGFDDGSIAAQIAASRIGKLTGIITAHLHIHRDKLDSRLQTDLQDILAQVGKLDYAAIFPSTVIDTKASIAPFDVADLTLLEQLESRTNTLLQSHCQ